MILGLDISTSITGFAIVADGQLLWCDSVDLRKLKDPFDKAEKIKEKMLQIYSEHNFPNSSSPVEHIYIEQPFKFYKKGGSSAKTMAILQSFNGVVSWQAYEIFGKKPKHIDAGKARRICEIKVLRGQNAKKVVMSHVLAEEPSFKIEYTRFGNPKQHYFDQADAIVIAKAGYKVLKNNIDL